LNVQENSGMRLSRRRPVTSQDMLRSGIRISTNDDFRSLGELIRTYLIEAMNLAILLGAPGSRPFCVLWTLTWEGQQIGKSGARAFAPVDGLTIAMLG
jgi:hypothetical protein